MSESTDECGRAAALAEYVLYMQHSILVGHKGQKTQKVISEKGEKQPIQTKYPLNPV